MHKTLNICIKFTLHNVYTQRLRLWGLDNKMRAVLDKRSLGLGLSGKHTTLFGKTHRMKAVAFKRLSDGPACLIFRDVYDDDPEKKKAFLAFLDIIYRVLHTTCDVDDQAPTRAHKTKISEFKTDTAVCLVLLEAELPPMFFDILLHELLHIPESIARWNHVRNYWAFASERYTQHTCTRVCCMELYINSVFYAYNIYYMP
jgi:hypothetical protein